MLDVLTLLNKVERVSRPIDQDNFVAAPGIWANVKTDGSLENVTADDVGKIVKLVINSASSNVYESHDIEVGRITTVESFGVRCKVDLDGYLATNMAQGQLLVVSNLAGSLGKLMVSGSAAEAGAYQIVAICEEYDSTAHTVIYKTLSPTVLTVSA